MEAPFMEPGVPCNCKVFFYIPCSSRVNSVTVRIEGDESASFTRHWTESHTTYQTRYNSYTNSTETYAVTTYTHHSEFLSRSHDFLDETTTIPINQTLGPGSYEVSF